MGSYRLVSWVRASAARGNIKLPVGSRWYCRHQHAFSRYFRLATRKDVARSSRRSLGTAKGRGLSPPASGGRRYSAATQTALLDFDRGASRFEVLLELRRVVLRHRFLDDAAGLGEVLGFLQAQAGDGADGLDDLDLLLAGGLQDDLELGLLFDRGSGGSRTGGHHDRGGGGDAELLFDGLDQLHHFHQGLRGNGVDDLFVGKG